jgi:hypothetical protein
MRDRDLMELASGMSPTRDFVDRSSFVELLEACERVGLQGAPVVLQVLPWVLTLAVRRVGEPYGRGDRIAGRPVVPDVGPEPPDPGLAVPRRKHRDRCIVGVELARGHHVNTDRLDQRSEQLAGCADPSGQRRSVEIESFASVDLRLSIQRKMICILRDQHMGEQPRTCETTIDGARRRRCLHDPVAGIAAQLRTDMADDLEAGPHALQHLGDIFAQLAQSAATVRAGLMVRHMGMDLAWQMLRQRSAEGLGGHGPSGRRDCGAFFDGVVSLQLFELQLQLFDLTEDLLDLRSEEHALELLDQQHPGVRSRSTASSE